MVPKKITKGNVLTSTRVLTLELNKSIGEPHAQNLIIIYLVPLTCCLLVLVFKKII